MATEGRRSEHPADRLEALAKRADDLALFLEEDGRRGFALSAGNLAREIRRIAASIRPVK